MSLRIKNVIFRNWNDIYDLTKRPKDGLDIAHHRNENNEDYVSLTGTKQQINHYLQDQNILSERLRTLNNVPKYRIINTTKQRIY